MRTQTIRTRYCLESNDGAGEALREEVKLVKEWNETAREYQWEADEKKV